MLPQVSTFGELWACYMAVLAHNGLKPSDVIERSGTDSDLVRQALARAIAHADHFIPSQAFASLLIAAGIADVSPWGRAYAMLEPTYPTAYSPGQAAVVGDNVSQVNLFYSPQQAPAAPVIAAAPPPSAGDLRARYYFRFLGQSLTQATVTFLLSMLVAASGMAIVLVGAGLAVVRANGHASTLVPVLTSVAGLAVTTCAGAIAVQANKARTHATEQAENVRRDMNSDQAFDRATTLIAKVDDPVLRDRLFAITAVNELGLSPNPIDLTQHLAPGTQSALPAENPGDGQLESGDGSNRSPQHPGPGDDTQQLG
jgi:hypothetical protein